jgi:carboxyl-terminal processing protease
MALDRDGFIAHAQTAATAPDFKLITEAWTKIEAHYVDRSAAQTKPLTYGAISGMVNALGDTGHTTFMTPEMVKSERRFTSGQFEGIGAQVEARDGHVVIVAPFDNSPAQRAGLRAGHIILKVNGNDMTGLGVEQVVSQILGPAGTTVALTILDPKTGKSFDLTLTRARIAVNNVTWQALPGTTIAHVRMTSFSQGVSQQLKKALTELQDQGMTGVILDLRNNPGGLLSEAIGTVSQFLSEGDVLQERDAQGQVIHIAVRPGGVATKIPLVVLLNKGSASASEIVAGAFQDANRATLVGETTFGTGTVLTQFPLSDGSALMLAIQEWLTPKGRVIWHKGIVPDQVVVLSPDVVKLTPAAERDLTLEQLKASGDEQLLAALNLFTKSAQPDGNHRSFALNPPWDFLQAPLNDLALELGMMKQFAFV